MKEDSSPHDGHRDRMRERIEADGIGSLQPHEVLEYLLYCCVPRKNTNDIAHELLKKFGSFSNVLNAEPERLCEVNGVTKNAALFLCSLPDVFRQYTIDSAKSRSALCGRGKAKEFMRACLFGKPVEQVYVAAVDARDNLIRFEMMSSGSGNSVDVSVRNVVDFALRTKASGILLAHNHPSGDVSPSENDYIMTRELVWTLDGIGVNMQDHFIFGGGECYSFEEDDQIKAIKNEKDTNLKEGLYFYDIKR